MKKTVFQILRFAAPVAIIGWLIYSIQRNDPESLRTLASQPKHWGLLGTALAAISTAVCISFCRWHMLVRALNIRFKLRDAFRLGLLGYLFNFVSLGVVGGDLFKAVFIAKEQKSKRAEAVASVLIDRILGLFGLLCVASLAMTLVRLPDNPELQALRIGTFLFTSIGAAGIGLLMIPGLTKLRLVKRLGSIPKLGPIFDRIVSGLELYRQRWAILLCAVGLSIITHSLVALGIHFAAHGIYRNSPGLVDHLVISPIAGVAGSIPLLPGGLGQYEFAIEFLYPRVSSVKVAPGQGLVVAFCYRVITVIIAMFGAVYYMLHRREVDDLVHEAEAIDQPCSDNRPSKDAILVHEASSPI